MVPLDIRRSARGLHARLLSWARQVANSSPVLKSLVHRVVLAAPSSLLSVINGSAGREVPYDAYRAAVQMSETQLEALREETQGWTARPLVSLLVAVYDTTPEHLRECVASVAAQAYEHWELCLVDDASPDDATWDLVQHLTGLDPRIKATRRPSNGGISAATNDALALASGEFCFLLDHDDILPPEALAEMVRVLQVTPDADVIYSDEDKVTADGLAHLSPHFKPDWSPELLWSANYITHFAGIRTSLLRELGGFDSECDGAQDWDILMRATAAARRVAHVPKVLYSWRLHERSTAQDMGTKPYAVEAQRRALQKAVTSAGVDGTVEQDKQWPSYWRVVRSVPEFVTVSVVVLADGPDAGRAAIEAVLASSSGLDLEVIVVDQDGVLPSGDVDRRPHDPRVRVVHADSAAIEVDPRAAGVAASSGEIIVLLAATLVGASDDWLTVLVSEAVRPEVGAVGGMVLRAGGHVVQSAGLSLGVGDRVAAPILTGAPVAARLSVAQHMLLYTQRDVSAVSADCLALRRTVWDEVGGLDPELRSAFGDVDLCCRIRAAGYRVVYSPAVRLFAQTTETSSTASSVGQDRSGEAAALVRQRWPELMARDPFRNPAFGGDDGWLGLTLPARSA